MYFQDPSSKGFAYVKKSYLVREATFVFMMGMFDLFVCFWNKTMILCPPLSHSRIRRSTRDTPQISNICLSFSLIWFRNKTLLYKLSLQGWKTDFLRVMLETLRSKLGLCLHYSTPSLSLDFSSSLLGDPSWLPKLSLEWNSRWLHVTTCKKKQRNTQTIKEWERLLKNVIRKMHRGSTSLPRVWNDKWQPIILNLRILSQVGV